MFQQTISFLNASLLTKLFFVPHRIVHVFWVTTYLQRLVHVGNISFSHPSHHTPQLIYVCAGLQGESLGTSAVLRVDAGEKRFVFEDVAAWPVPSLLRNFSAPVKLEVNLYVFVNSSGASLQTGQRTPGFCCTLYATVLLTIAQHPTRMTLSAADGRCCFFDLAGGGPDGGGPDVPASPRHGPVLPLGGGAGPWQASAAASVRYRCGLQGVGTASSEC